MRTIPIRVGPGTGDGRRGTGPGEVGVPATGEATGRTEQNLKAAIAGET
jgi:hypothetical protein